MHFKVIMWQLQPIMFSWRQNSSSSYFASWSKTDTTQKCMLCIIIHFLKNFRIQIVWFQQKRDADRIRISFFKNRIGSDSKKHSRSSLLQSGAVTRTWRWCQDQLSQKTWDKCGSLKKGGYILQTLSWHCVQCSIHYEKGVREEQHSNRL